MLTSRRLFPQTLRIEHVNFQKRDQFRRAYGCRITSFECAFSYDPEGQYSNEAGIYFAALVVRTRGGNVFSSNPQIFYFLNEAERDKYIGQRVSKLREDAEK